MQRATTRKALLFLTLLLAAAPALAYIGPGAGISFLGSLFTWVAGAVIALLAVLLWPLRAVFRRMRPGAGKSRQGDTDSAVSQDTTEDFSTEDLSTKD